MAGEALELALALQRAPIQRFALRGRPLPDDIGTVIQLASGNQGLLDEAAQRHGEASALILDAVRFYLQQVLFDEDADAYRTLGLTQDAPSENIRQHYRWLQSWLHPDRRGEEWEAHYATRVNWAWNQLRSVSVREAYDRQQASISAQAEAGTHLAAPAAAGEWRAVPTEAPPASWRSRILLGVSLGSCAVLLLLVLMKENGPPVEWPAPPPSTGGDTRASAAGALPALADARTVIPNTRPPMPEASAAADPSTPRQQSPEDSQRIGMPPMPDGRFAAPAESFAPDSSDAVPRTALAAAREPLPAEVSLPSTSKEVLAASQEHIDASEAAAVVSVPPAITGSAMSEAPAVESIPAAGGTVLRDTALAVQTPPPQALPRIDDLPSSAPIPAAPVARAATAVKPDKAPGSVPRDRRRQPMPVQAAEHAPSAAAPESALAAKAAVSPTVAEPEAQKAAAPEPAGQGLPPAESQVAQVTPAAAPATPIPTPVAVAVAPAAVSTSTNLDDMPARVDLARKRVRDIVAYFRRPDAAMPDWRDAQAQSAAQRQRDALRDRNGAQHAGGFALEPPVWRMSDEVAALDAIYHVRGERSVSESGHFSVDMVWSGRTWQVTRIELQPSR